MLSNWSVLELRECDLLENYLAGPVGKAKDCVFIFVSGEVQLVLAIVDLVFLRFPFVHVYYHGVVPRIDL
jgi:hypothetical protein